MAALLPQASTEVDGWVAEIQEAVLDGIGAEGPPASTVVDRLLKTDALAQWVAVNEDGTKALKLKGAPGERLAKDTLEHAVRAACSRLIKQAAEQGTNAMLCRHGLAAEPSLERLLDFTVSSSAVAPENYDTALPYTLMDDIIEQSTVAEGELVFKYLETRIEALRRVHVSFEKSPAKLAVLRICNQLLRRLSRPSSSELCGRITMFLTPLLPLLDRSGLNVPCAFNDSHSTPVEDVPEGALDSFGQPIDRAFYMTFWGLQAVFQQPYSIMEPTAWASAVGSIRRVLSEFRKQPVGLSSSSSSAEVGSMADEVTLTVKYLSSPRLLRLQLQDAALRRHFLVQALICLHACQNPIAKGGAQQQLRRDALRSKQVVEAEELEGQLYAELEGLPKYGGQFASAIRCILKRENRWGAWKADSCPTFERRSTVELQPLPLRKLAPRKALPYGRVDVGVPALNRLRNACKDNVSCLTGKGNKRAAPQFREFMEPVITEMDPEECVEEQYKTKRDPIYAWKALRLAVRESLPSVAATIEPLAQRPPQKQPQKRRGIDLEDLVHKVLPDDVPEALRKQPEAESGQVRGSALPSQAALQDVSQATALTISSKPLEGSSASEAAAADSQPAAAAPAAGQDAQPEQAAVPMQTDAGAPADAAEQVPSAAEGAQQEADTPAVEHGANVHDTSAPAEGLVGDARKSIEARSRSDPLDKSTAAAPSIKQAPSLSAPNLGSTLAQQAEQANDGSSPAPVTQKSFPAQAANIKEEGGSPPAENGAVKKEAAAAVEEEEAAADARPTRQAAKRARRS